MKPLLFKIEWTEKIIKSTFIKNRQIVQCIYHYHLLNTETLHQRILSIASKIDWEKSNKNKVESSTVKATQKRQDCKSKEGKRGVRTRGHKEGRLEKKNQLALIYLTFKWKTKIQKNSLIFSLDLTSMQRRFCTVSYCTVNHQKKILHNTVWTTALLILGQARLFHRIKQ